MKYDGKDSADSSCDEFLEVPICNIAGGSSLTGRFADFLGTSSETSPTCDTYTDHETLHRKEGIGHENRRFALAHPAGSHSAKNVWHTEGKETVNPPLGGIRLPLLVCPPDFCGNFMF